MGSLKRNFHKSPPLSTFHSIFKEKQTVLSIAACVSGVLFLSVYVGAQTYTVTDLGTFKGGTVAAGQGLNNCGDVVGYARFKDYDAHGFEWNTQHGLRDLGSILPYTNFSVAQAVNSSRVIAGYSTFNYPPYLTTHAVLWIQGKIHDIGGINAQAMGINDNAEVTGFSVPTAFRWTPSKGMEDLGALPGGYYSQGLAINNFGTIAGFSNAADGNWHGFVWTESQGMQALPYLLATDNSASANGINRRGHIVGGSGGSAVLWKDATHVEDLGIFPNQGWSTAFAINDKDEVIGWSGFRAFLWTRAKGIRDLNDLIPNANGWFLSLPTGINNRGQITGQGSINGEQHAFLLTPVGETVDACN